MKKILTFAAGCALALAIAAQEPQEIKGIIVEEHDTEWYARQAEAWERVVKAEPQNEQAWRNLYEALHYRYMHETNEGAAVIEDVLRRMGESIPDTYIYNRCMYRHAAGTSEGDRYARRMVELMPEHPGRDLEEPLCWYWRTGQWEELEGTARRYFAEDVMPTKLLRYNYNQLQGLPEGAIFFGRGDAELIPKLMLQAGSGVHRDKVIVPLPFLHDAGYVEALCRKLGIDTLPKTWKEFYGDAGEEARKRVDDLSRTYLQMTALHLMRRSGRAAYFTTSVAEGEMRELADNLYSEGIALRYSEEPYDNKAQLRRNVEERYTLDYLLEPPFRNEPHWQAAEWAQANYITMLAPLAAWYYQKAQAAANGTGTRGTTGTAVLEDSRRLSRFLLRALERMDIPAPTRLQLKEYVESQAPLPKD